MNDPSGHPASPTPYRYSICKAVREKSQTRPTVERLAKRSEQAGELLRQFDGRPDNAAKQTTATDTLISQRQASEQAGELLRQFDGKGKNQYSEGTDGTDGKLTQGQVAAKAGMSERQQLTAWRSERPPREPSTIAEFVSLAGCVSNFGVYERFPIRICTYAEVDPTRKQNISINTLSVTTPIFPK